MLECCCPDRCPPDCDGCCGCYQCALAWQAQLPEEDRVVYDYWGVSIIEAFVHQWFTRERLLRLLRRFAYGGFDTYEDYFTYGDLFMPMRPREEIPVEFVADETYLVKCWGCKVYRVDPSNRRLFTAMARAVELDDIEPGDIEIFKLTKVDWAGKGAKRCGDYKRSSS